MAEETEITFMRSGDDGTNLADDPKFALVAACVVMQQAAGFRDKNGNALVDLRQVDCPECDAPGFNTGWGIWLFQCGAEITTGTDAEISKPCGAPGHTDLMVTPESIETFIETNAPK